MHKTSIQKHIFYNRALLHQFLKLGKFVWTTRRQNSENPHKGPSIFLKLDRYSVDLSVPTRYYGIKLLPFIRVCQ